VREMDDVLAWHARLRARVMTLWRESKSGETSSAAADARARDDFGSV